MQIETKEVRDGKHDGEIVWICHYLRPDMAKKALRSVPPVKVLIRSNDELPKNKKVYYSASHFSPLNASGKPSARVLSPVDNTGFRMRCGNELHVFDNEKECRDAWNTQLMAHVANLDVLIAEAANHWQQEKETLLEARQ